MKPEKMIERTPFFGYTKSISKEGEEGMVSLAKSELKSIKIKGFKSIKEQTIEFNRINVLIGSNGAGKSNFISAFTLLEEILKKHLAVYSGQRGADALLYYGRKETESISMEFIFGNENSYGFELVPTDDGRLIFEKEYYGYKGTHTGIIGEGHPESAWEKGVPNYIDYYVRPILKENSWRVYHFNDTSPEARVKQIHNIGNNIYLQNDAGNLAAFLYRLKKVFPESYQRIVEIIQMAAPYFGDFYLEPQELNSEQIRLRWREKDHDSILNAAQFSDGTLRFICLATLLMQPEALRPSTIIIDEPEIGLHPFAINLLSELVRKASFSSQVILSTQSSELLDNCEPENVIVVTREGNGTTFSKLDSAGLQSWLEDYNLGELWRKNIFGGRLAR